MAISTQRLLIIVITIDVLMIIFGALAVGAETTGIENDIDNKMIYYQNWTYDYNENLNNPTVDESSTILDEKFSNTKGMGFRIIEIFREGTSRYMTLDCFGEPCDNNYIKHTANAIKFIWLALHFILALEALLLVYAKKNT